MTQSNPSRRIIPGSVFLYRESRPDRPLWPSVYLTDDATPKSFLDTRPHGFYSVVLKLASNPDASHLRWAQTSQMIPFDPLGADEATKRSTPGLEDAYNVAREAEESEFDLDYWKVILTSVQVPEVITIDSDDDEVWRNDPDMLLAIQLSIKDDTFQKAQRHSQYPVAHPRPSNARPGFPFPFTKTFTPHPTDSNLLLPIRRPAERTSKLPTPTPSPPSKYYLFEHSSPLSRYPGPLSPCRSNYRLPLPSQKRKLSAQAENSRRGDPFLLSSQPSYNSPSPTYDISDEDSQELSPRRRKSSVATGPSRYFPQQSVARSRKPTSGLSAQQDFCPTKLNVSASAAPDGDILEEDLDESSQFVQVFVGPEVDPTTNDNVDPQRRRYKLQLLKYHIWDRPYFRNALSGRNYFEPIGDNTWELVHPRLKDISPEDFRMVAEFLSDGDFGIRDPETEEQVAETFAQCISAWKSAEILSMDDLLEHIVHKIRATRPWWDMWNIMAFACEIYKSEITLQAHDDMKAMLSEAIAEIYDIYLEDDNLRGQFVTRLKQLPELKRSIHSKIVEQIDRRLQPQADEGVVLPEDHSEAEDDTYMYN